MGFDPQQIDSRRDGLTAIRAAVPGPDKPAAQAGGVHLGAAKGASVDIMQRDEAGRRGLRQGEMDRAAREIGVGEGKFDGSLRRSRFVHRDQTRLQAFRQG